MHPVASSVAENVAQYPQLVAPLLFSVFAAVANVHEPTRHSLLVSAVSWGIIWLLAVFKAGIWANTSSGRRRACLLAGGFLVLAHVCERAACDKEGIWATKSFIPLFIVLLSKNDLLSKYVALPTHAPQNEATHAADKSYEDHPHTASYRLLAALTVSAGSVLSIYSASSTTTLGVCSAIFTATGLVLFDETLDAGEDDTNATSAREGPLRGRVITASSMLHHIAALRDVAAILMVGCGIAVILMEPSLTSIISWEPAYREYNPDWKNLQDSGALQGMLWMIPINVIANVLMFITLSQYGAIGVSLFALFSYICARLLSETSFSNLWFALTYASSALLYMFGNSSTLLTDKRSSVRIIRRVTFGILTISILLLLFRYATEARQSHASTNTATVLPILPPTSQFEPIPMALKIGHPAAQLTNAAETEFQQLLDRQSSSLASAVSEYRRRYGIAPPPHFDKWYEFAVRNNVVMIDEYDMINEMLVPFWAVSPATIRSRITKELGGEDNALIGVAVRNGEILAIENGEEWQQKATAGMMKDFVQHLPDMDLGFNIHDEPRVVVPNNLLSSMVSKARDEVLPRTAKQKSPRNAFSDRPKDMNDGKRFVETYVSKFNRFAHQQTWTQSRLSCPADSQAQTFEDYAPDNRTAYAAGQLEYIYNATAFSDICKSPSLSSTYGFFERPNAFNVVNELTPVFSQSKISSFQDILYPSPWYWSGKVAYDESHDTSWENKTNALYWRGSTTGGFSRNSGWRRQHRQHIVQRLNAPDKAQVVVPTSSTPDSTAPADSHSLVYVDRRSLKHLMDVHFSHVGQCDPADCDAQREFFHVTEHADGQDAWYFKHLLDMDGNAFSGRFYSFLKSHSLTYKMAIFREWHAEWLKPWVHYIPLSLKGDEHLDLVKWFSGGEANEGEQTPNKGGNGDSPGERKAREIAERSTQWHDKALRNVDFEAWFFRLLLEYGRIIDDNREEIGYPGP